MKFARLRISSADREGSPLYEALANTEASESVRVRYGGVNDDGPRTYVCSVAGDVDTIEKRLESTEGIFESDVLRRQGDYALLYVLSEPNYHELWLQALFTRGSLTMIPPVDVEADGSFVFRVVGHGADLQEAVAETSDELPIDVERVGAYNRPDERLTASLTSRQTEAVQAALSVGYYTIPREGTHEDVAAVLDCAPSTASEHLRKAEARLVRTVFEEV